MLRVMLMATTADDAAQCDLNSMVPMSYDYCSRTPHMTESQELSYIVTQIIAPCDNRDNRGH